MVKTINPRLITVDDVRTYIKWLQKSGRNSSTQRNALLLLNEFLTKMFANLSTAKLERQWPLDARRC